MLNLDTLASEAANEPFTFRFDDTDYTMPGSVDVRAVAKLEAGDLDAFIRVQLGAEQWARMMASPKTFDAKLFEALLAGYFEHVGLSAGNSSGSTGS